MVKKSVHHHKVLRLFVYGYTLLTPKTQCFRVRKNMEFSLQEGDMSFFVVCKFEILNIFKIA